MKRSPLGFLICHLGLLITVAFTGCGGTETGNPLGPGGGGGDRNPAVELGGAVCEKLTACFGEEQRFTQQDCEQALEDSETLGPAFGVEEEPPPEYALVIEKVDKSELSADDEAVEGCLSAIDALPCEDPSVLAVDIRSGFSNVEEMIPEASCSAVFSVP